MSTNEPDDTANYNSTTAQAQAALPPKVVDETGYERDILYDVNGNPERITHPDGSYEKMVYDSENRITYQRDREGNVTTYEYFSSGSLKRVVRGLVDPGGSVERRHPAGRVSPARPVVPAHR